MQRSCDVFQCCCRDVSLRRFCDVTLSPILIRDLNLRRCNVSWNMLPQRFGATLIQHFVQVKLATYGTFDVAATFFFVVVEMFRCNIPVTLNYHVVDRVICSYVATTFHEICCHNVLMQRFPPSSWRFDLYNLTSLQHSYATLLRYFFATLLQRYCNYVGTMLDCDVTATTYSDVLCSIIAFTRKCFIAVYISKTLTLQVSFKNMLLRLYFHCTTENKVQSSPCWPGDLMSACSFVLML